MILIALTRMGEEPIPTIDNGSVRVSFATGGGPVSTSYEVRAGAGWTAVLKSFVGTSGDGSAVPPLLSPTGTPGRVLVDERLTVATVDDDGRRAVLSGKDAEGSYEVTVSLPDDEARVHVVVSAELVSPALEYLLSSFVFVPGRPDFVHTPCLKQDPEDVIADRTFYQPAAILQAGPTSAALVPDLHHLNEHPVIAADARTRPTTHLFQLPVDVSQTTMPTAFDVTLDSADGRPVVAFGLCDSSFVHHVRWHHSNDGSLVRHPRNGNVSFAFDVLLAGQAPERRAYQSVARFLWDQYGRPELGTPRPQVEPWKRYAELCYPAAFEWRGDLAFPWGRLPTAEDRPDTTWQELELDGETVGGIRAAPSHWYHDIQFMAWWNNARDAVSMYRWGVRLGDAGLVDKARKIVNLAMHAPQRDGLFPTVFRYDTKTWSGGYWGNFPAEYDPSSTFDVWDFASPYQQMAACSKTVAHLLRYRRLCEDDPRILPFATAYGDFLLAHLDEPGCIPAFFGPDLEPVPWLRWNAEGGVHAWALAALHRATGEGRFLRGAERLGQFLVDQVLPDQRWYDQETFYSCARKPEGFVDEITGQPPRCTLSMLWAVEGFLELWEASGGEERWSAAAEAVADYLSFFQAVWQPRFIITAYAYGGFGTQNTDCEWLDMRQAQAGEAFARLALATGRQDMAERAVAAVRSQFAIVPMPTNRDNLVQTTCIFPLGACSENIDHEGLPQEPLRSGADWGEVGGLCGVDTLLDLFGSVHVDLDRDVAIGVDGLHVDAVTVDGGRIDITVRSLLEELRVPPTSPYLGELRLAGLQEGGEHEVAVNGCVLAKGTASELTSIPILVERGTVSRT